MTEHRHGLGIRIAWNSLIQAVSLVAGAAISLGTVAAIARGLGPTTFGHYATAIAFLAIPVTVADAGLSNHVLREISRSPESEQATLCASLVPRTILSAAAISAAVICSQILPLDAETQGAVAVGALGAFLTLLTLSLMPLLTARLLLGWSSIATLIGRLVTLITTLFAISHGGGLEGIVWAYVAGYFVTFVIVAGVVARQIRLRPYLDGSYARRLFREAAPLAVAQGVAQIYYRADTLLLAFLRPAREVGLYAAAFKFMELAAFVGSSLLTAISGPLNRFAATRDVRTRDLVQRVFDVLVFVGLPIAVVLYMNAETLITLVGGEAFRDGAVALQILAVYPLLGFLTQFADRAMIAVGDDRVLAVWNVGFLILNVALNLVLIPIYGFAAAAAVAVGTEAIGLIVAAPLIFRTYGFLPSLRGVATIFVAGGLLVVLMLILPGPGLLVAALATTVYAVTLAIIPGSISQIVRDLRHGLRPIGSAGAT